MAGAWRFGLVFQDLCDHGSEGSWVLDTRVGEAGGLGSKERWAPGASFSVPTSRVGVLPQFLY